MGSATLFDLNGVDVDIPEWMKTKNFVLAETVETVRRFVDEAITSGICALDLETQGLDNRVYFNSEKGKFETKHKIVGFCLCKDDRGAIYIPVRHDSGGNLDVDVVEQEIVRLVNGCTSVIFHHAKFDTEFLAYMDHGIDIDNRDKFEDTLVADFIRNSNNKNHGLKFLSKEFLKIRQIELSELFPKAEKNRSFAMLNPKHQGVVEYACADAYCTYMLWKTKFFEVKRDYQLCYDLDKTLVSVLRRIERCRLKVDKVLIAELRRKADELRDDSIRKFLEASKPFLKEGEELKISSPAQLAELLYKRMGIPPPESASDKGKTDQVSTDEDTFKKIKSAHPDTYPILQHILDYRMCEGTISKFLIPLSQNTDANDEIRISFKEDSADTGRLSAPGGKPEQGFSGVNFHGLPKPDDEDIFKIASEVRNAIVARPGFVMVKIDFSAEELRIAANLSREPKWIAEFNTGSGDLHTLMALEIFGSKDKKYRKYAKGTNFALLYGGGVMAIMRSTGLPQEKAQELLDNYFKKVPTLKKWIDKQKEQAKRDMVVYTSFKRPLFLPDINNPEDQGHSLRKAINSPIQGTGADIIKYAMVKVDKLLQEKGWYPNIARVLLNVHDELVLEIKPEYIEEALPLICDRMTDFGRLMKWPVPLEVEPQIDHSWGMSGDHNWYKMKAGNQEIPEFLVPYIHPLKPFEAPKKVESAKPNDAAQQTPAQSGESTPASQPNESLKKFDVYDFRLNRPLSNHTMLLLKHICKVCEIPTVTEHKTILLVSTIEGEEIIGQELNISVDAYKFKVLTEYFGL